MVNAAALLRFREITFSPAKNWPRSRERSQFRPTKGLLGPARRKAKRPKRCKKRRWVAVVPHATPDRKGPRPDNEAEA